MNRIPGTYEPGDRVKFRNKLAAMPDVEGTVAYDNRKDGGHNVWVLWDNSRGEQMCCTPDTFISVEAGK